MEIELEPAKPNFSRCWVTDGFDDFLEAAKRYFAQHQGDGHELRVADSLLDREDDRPDDDGIRRVWLDCRCGGKRLILGPPSGDADMRPPFPRATVTDSRIH